jgi:hypothetical protein
VRKIQTYVLRLLGSTDDPRLLRGEVTSVINGDAHTFRDGESLLAWLCRMNEAVDDDQPGESLEEGECAQ